MKRRPSGTTLHRSRDEFESALAAMAGDPQVQAECAAIARDFAAQFALMASDADYRAEAAQLMREFAAPDRETWNALAPEQTRPRGD